VGIGRGTGKLTLVTLVGPVSPGAELPSPPPWSTRVGDPVHAGQARGLTHRIPGNRPKSRLRDAGIMMLSIRPDPTGGAQAPSWGSAGERNQASKRSVSRRPVTRAARASKSAVVTEPC
jgi:hypothetical protein